MRQRQPRHLYCLLRNRRRAEYRRERKHQSRLDGRKSRSKAVSIEKLTARRDACLHMMETMANEIENLRRDTLWLALPPAKRRSMTDARGYWKQCYEEASQKLDQAIAEKRCG